MTTITSNERRTSALPVTANKRLWAGRIASALVIAMLLLSSSLKLLHAPEFVAKWTGALGWTEGTLTSIGLLELACVAIYAVPRTALLGAVLLTGYFGGAIASHVRIGDAFVVPLVLGIVVWGGLYLRDERLHALLRRPA